MHAPTSQLAGDESLLAQHLADGAKILAEAPDPDLTPPTSLSDGLRAPALVRPAGERDRADGVSASLG